MRDRAGQFLKAGCYVLAALLIVQVARAILQGNPLAHVSIPAVPSLSAENHASSAAKATNSSAARKPSKNETRVHAEAQARTGTNQDSTSTPGKAGTNASVAAESPGHGTNVVRQAESDKQPTHGTARLETGAQEGNSASHPEPARSGADGAGIQDAVGQGTNAVTAGKLEAIDTNAAARNVPAKTGTNLVLRDDLVASPHSGPRVSPAPAMMGVMGMPGMGQKLPDLPIETKARVYRIVDSELLGPVIHPLPMGLLGIAGEVAFLRSPSGQTGLVKEGDSMGEMKLLKIGTNRVLVEEDGQKKELTIFNGYGGESLLPKPGETPNESAKK